MWNDTVSNRTAGRLALVLRSRRALVVPRVTRLVLGLICGLISLLAPALVQAAEVDYFRIATGPTDGIYFPIGSLISSAISKPPGALDCADGGSCGVPGLIAVSQATEGSVQNIEMIAAGSVESGLSQADVAYMAYFGLGRFKGKAQFDGLRVVATLFPELVQVAVRKHSGIYALEDLAGKRVSLGAKGSGTTLDAEVIMAAHGLKIDSYKPLHFGFGESADRLRLGRLDAFFIIAGAPVPAMVDLAEQTNITLLPIKAPAAERLRKAFAFFVPRVLPAGIYRNVEATETLSVGAQWLVSDRLSEDLVYDLTRALWHPSTRRVLDNGHPDGRLIQLKSALDGLAIPLHPGARRYYQEVGALPQVK
ncbi:MAG: TAXI family TRAP transporter solute-binding subunit [Alphaproteobacteria bacterium]|nr:TAXI family TRAP transporter solute-binding subunit [Alphaproteobacteria bacterium]